MNACCQLLLFVHVVIKVEQIKYYKENLKYLPIVLFYLVMSEILLRRIVVAFFYVYIV